MRTGWRRRVALIAVTLVFAWSCAAGGTAGGPSPSPSRTVSGSPTASATTPPASDDVSPTAPGATATLPAASPSRSEAGLPADLTLVWTRSQLPDGYAERVATDPAVGALLTGKVATLPLVRTVAADGTVVDQETGGWFLPVETVAVDPSDHVSVFDRNDLAGLAAGEAVLSATSAEVRRLGVGARLVFADGTEVEVVAILPDEVVAAAEVLVPDDGTLEVATPRFLLARPARAGTDLEPVLRSHLPEDLRATVATPGETPILRHADAVLAPARVKQLFGEFAMRDTPGRRIEQEQAWIDEHITTEEVPILGSVTCHREIIPAVRGALQQLVDEGRSGSVDPSDYAGCWSPRTQAVGAPLSHHAWGIAIDFNAGANPFGGTSTQDPRLVEAMRQHGFTWGDPWLIPDPMHFEAGHDWPANGTSRSDR